MNQLGPYQLLQLIGQGSHGSLYQAKRGHQLFALKLFHKDCPPKALEESNILAQLAHPNIVGFVEANPSGEKPYLVTQWVEGQSLDKQCQPKNFSSVLKLCVEVLMGLSALHRKGWVHGDIKDSNILWGKDKIQLIDLGLARSVSQQDLPSGTLAYLAPEVILGNPAQAQSDLYALGLVLYRWISGEFPFSLSIASEVIRWHLLETPRLSQQNFSFLPQTFRDFILRLLAKSPEDRFCNARQALAWLEKEFSLDSVSEEPFTTILLESDEKEMEINEKSFEILGEAIRYYEKKKARSSEEDLILAELYYRQGHLKKAATLSSLLKTTGGSLLRVKVLTRMGKFETALQLLEDLAIGQPSFSEKEKLAYYNNYGVLSYYLEKMEDSEAYFAKAYQLAEKNGELADLAVAYNNIANVLLNKGKVDAAQIKFSQSVALSQKSGDRIHEGMFLVSQGYFFHLQEQYGEALAAYNEGIEILMAIGQSSESARARLNRANLNLCLGDLNSAAQDLRQAQKVFQRRGMTYLWAYSHLIEGDLFKQQKKWGQALQCFQASATELQKLQRLSDSLWAQLHQAECYLEKQSYTKTTEILKALEPEIKSQQDPRTLGHFYFLQGRAFWGQGQKNQAVQVSFPNAESFLTQAHDQSGLLLLHFAWGELLDQERQDSQTRQHCQQHYQKALQILENLTQKIPLKSREQFLIHSPKKEIERRLVAMESITFPEKGDLKISTCQSFFAQSLQTLEKELMGELELSVLLEKILDRLLVLTQAERGFIILDETPKPRLVVSRNLDQHHIKDSKNQISWSVAHEVLLRGTPLLTIDALEDDRFSVTDSIHHLKLRSILCLPFKNGIKVLGVIYLDHRNRPGVFSKQLFEALTPFADLVGQALENAHRFTQVQSDLKTTQRKLAAMETELRGKYQYHNMVGRHSRMLEVFQIIDRVLDICVPVMILGESGTGKELIAKAIHFNGPRANHPFVSLNCQAIPEGLFESELFGHLRGSFTGAVNNRVGLVEQAHHGTLFLDEIGDMPLFLQGKLLRFLQEGKIRRVGEQVERDVDCRIVAATHQNLTQMIQEKKFREDLYFRLNVVEINLPPLRDRIEDLPLLADHFLTQFSQKQDSKKMKLSSEALELLMHYPWPGNVRELENTLINACVFAEGSSIPVKAFRYKADLNQFKKQEVNSELNGTSVQDKIDWELPRSLREGVESYERRIIEKALQRFQGNITRAAIGLQVARPQLSRMIKRFGLKVSEARIK